MKSFSPSTLILILSLLFLLGCGKSEDEDLAPVVYPPLSIKTGEALNITSTSAEVEGLEIVKGRYNVEQKGIYISRTSEAEGEHEEDRTFNYSEIGTDDFLEEVNFLWGGTKYFARAFVFDGTDTAVGNEVTFQTEIPCSPIANTMTLGSSELTFSSVAVVEPKYGNYAIAAIDGEYTVSLEFASAPKTDSYSIFWESPFIPDNRCLMLVDGPGIIMYSSANVYEIKVYVEKEGEDLYTITFCDLFLQGIPNLLGGVKGKIVLE